MDTGKRLGRYGWVRVANADREILVRDGLRVGEVVRAEPEARGWVSMILPPSSVPGMVGAEAKEMGAVNLEEARKKVLVQALMMWDGLQIEQIKGL